MSKYLYIVLIAMLLITGCGTTKKVLEADQTSSGDVVIPQTVAVENTSLVLQIDATPGVRDLLIAPVNYTAEADSLIEVYSSTPFTAAHFVASTNASAAGTFIADLGEDETSYNVLYVMATAPGKTRSDAVVITK
jgi:hypothetical protein